MGIFGVGFYRPDAIDDAQLAVCSQGRSDGGGYWYLYPPKMTSERLLNSFIPPKQISGYAPVDASSISAFNGRPDKIRQTRVGFSMD